MEQEKREIKELPHKQLIIDIGKTKYGLMRYRPCRHLRRKRQQKHYTS